MLVMDFEDTATTYKQRGSILAFDPGIHGDSFAYFNVAVTALPTSTTLLDLRRNRMAGRRS